MRILFLALAVLFSTIALSQSTGSVRGKILDKEMFNEPLLMAQVALKNTDWSDQTNFNGNFEINDIEPGLYTLTVVFLGYEKLELPIEIREDQQVEIIESLRAKTLRLPVMTENSEKVASNPTLEPLD